MILVDTSIWVDHLRKGDLVMQHLLERRRVLSHPMVTGEIALGHLHDKDDLLSFFDLLPHATVARDPEVIWFISDHRLFGRGIGYVDAHLLASVRLTPGAALWTRDKRLRGIADCLHLSYAPV